MNKCDIRKKIIRYKKDLKYLKKLKAETISGSERQTRDIEILKDKIKYLEKELKK